MQINQFETQMWCYNLMFGKKYFSHVSLLLCIYIYLTHTSRDPGWLNWEFDYKTVGFTIGALVATQETCANVLYSWAKYRSFDYKTEQPFDGALTFLCKGDTLQWDVRIPVIKE